MKNINLKYINASIIDFEKLYALKLLMINQNHNVKNTNIQDSFSLKNNLNLNIKIKITKNVKKMSVIAGPVINVNGNEK